MSETVPWFWEAFWQPAKRFWIYQHDCYEGVSIYLHAEVALLYSTVYVRVFFKF